MDISNLTPNPHATSYYDRLDVAPDADDKTVSKAGKVALSEFSETETQLLLNVKQARSVLVDSETRDIYDGFIDEFGVETGTRAFEDWEQASGVSVEEFKSRIESAESDSTEDIEWENIEISSPSVIRSRSDTDKYVEVNLWEGDRLYINEFHDEDIFIDVDTGRIYTQDYQEITDIERELSGDESQLKLQYNGQTLYIELKDGGSWGDDMVEVESAVLDWVNKNRLRNGSVSFWSRGDVAPRIYLNDVFDIGDVYINTENGLVYSQDDNSVVQSATCNLNSKGDELHLSYEDATVKISLISPDHPTPFQTTPPTEDDSHNNQEKDRRDRDDKRKERNKRQDSNGDSDSNSEEFEDAYDGKEFGYDPDEEGSPNDNRYKETNDTRSEDDRNPTYDHINPFDTFSVYGGGSRIVQLLLYPFLIVLFPGVYSSLKLKWRWQFVFGVGALGVGVGIQSTYDIATLTSIVDILYLIIGPAFFAFSIPVFPVAALGMNGEPMAYRLGVGLYPLVYWFIVSVFIDYYLE